MIEKLHEGSLLTALAQKLAIEKINEIIDYINFGENVPEKTKIAFLELDRKIEIDLIENKLSMLQLEMDYLNEKLKTM